MQLFGILLSKVYKETQNCHFFELKWLIPLSLSVLCASDNLDNILLQLTLYIKPQELRRLFVDPLSLQASLKHSYTSYGPLKD